MSNEMILTALSVATSLITLITFVAKSWKSARDAGAREALLNNSIMELTKTVTELQATLKLQHEDYNSLRTDMQLLLQQHNQNHGRTIGGKST
jgi:hypothetical protein